MDWMPYYINHVYKEMKHIYLKKVVYVVLCVLIALVTARAIDLDDVTMHLYRYQAQENIITSMFPITSWQLWLLIRFM